MENFIYRMEKKKSTPKSSTKKAKSPVKSVKKSVGKEGGARKPYEYTKLEDLFKGELERVNLYAVIMDASAPYYLDAVHKYLCTAKLIDNTINPRDSTSGKPAFLSVTFFANNKGEIPQASRIGSIIRIHRGDTKKFEKSFQLNCDAGIKAAWALFDPAETMIPVAHTGRTYTFVDDDKKRLKDIRKFGEKFLEGFDVTDASSIGAKKGEVDMFALVLNRKNKDATYDRLSVFDGEDFYKLNIYKDKYTHIAPQDIIRVRGLSKKGGEFVVNEYTNIMKLDKDNGAAKALEKKIKKAKEEKEISDKLAFHTPTPKTVGEVSDKKALKTPIALKKLFGLDASELKEKHYRANVNVLEIGPKDPKSWLVPLDAKSRKQYSLPEDVTHYYKVQLFGKDATAPEDPNIYTLYLCTIDGKGKEFLPTPPAAKGKKVEKEPSKELKRIYKVLTQPWTTLNVALEGVAVAGGSPVFFIVDTKLNL